MTGSVLVCATFAVGVAPGPPVPANQAPHPRLVKPDASLVVVEWLPGAASTGEPNQARLWKLGFRNGKPLPPAKVWEGEEEFLHPDAGRRRIVSDRLLVTERGGVIDLREMKVLSSERDGWVEHVDEKKIVYRIESNRRPEGRFSFEYATGTVTLVAKAPAPRPWYDELQHPNALSPDRKKAIRWEDNDELVLYRDGERPKSLGKGFKMEEAFEAKIIRSHSIMYPVLWLDSDRILTQRDHGQLVIVDLAEKVTEVVTIKGAPKLTTPTLGRDRSGTISYFLDGVYYKIDLVKKTAEKNEWEGLGHGFEATWARHDKFGHKLRYNGKDIGQFRCAPYTARTAPGYLAIDADQVEERLSLRRRIAVWSAATGEWTATHYEWLGLMPVVGWIK